LEDVVEARSQHPRFGIGHEELHEPREIVKALSLGG
jgi:hypothetical protein